MHEWRRDLEHPFSTLLILFYVRIILSEDYAIVFTLNLNDCSQGCFQSININYYSHSKGFFSIDLLC